MIILNKQLHILSLIESARDEGRNILICYQSNFNIW